MYSTDENAKFRRYWQLIEKSQRGRNSLSMAERHELHRLRDECEAIENRHQPRPDSSWCSGY